MSSIKKRGAVYGVVALMLCVAVYLNWSYFQTPEEMAVANQVKLEEDTDSSTDATDKTDSTADTSADGSDSADQTDSKDSTESGKVYGDTTEVSSEGDYFAQARLTRQKSRDEAISILNSTLENEAASEEAKEKANEQISRMADYSVKESELETLIKGKGYSDAVVYISDGSVSVIVAPPEGGLKAEDVAKITDLTVEKSGLAASAVKISEAK
ncbi:MAG: SpoIIIAH-like family protein [Butyricicoccaceae bacterium]